jgi:hypothetical protein
MAKNKASSANGFELYSRLANAKKYMHESDLEFGYLYYISARNAHLGIWNPGKRGFVISRYKFDLNYLFIEYHYDTGSPYGTVKPFIKIEKNPFDDKSIQIISEGPEQLNNVKLSVSILEYLNRKAIEVPFTWIKDKLNSI